MKPLILCYL